MVKLGLTTTGRPRSLDRFADLVHGETHSAAGGFTADLGDDVLEHLPVLAALDGVEIGADELDAVALQRPVLVQRDRGVERGLAAQGGQQRVDLVAALGLLSDHLLHEGGGDGLDVGVVGVLRVGHDGGRVGVDQADLQALGAQHTAGLGSGVVEFAGLPDHDRPRADDQHVAQVGAARHQRPPAIRSMNWSNRYSASCGPAAASGWYCTENARPSESLTPSTTPSLAQVWLTSAGPNGVSKD